ncbi:protein O-mannosyl-transferase 2 isoform X1 [Biomphalaria glabrata]|nr:protein O-mannosyl-transferase 2 isoform X1 [Biomphalaria glabrata]
MLIGFAGVMTGYDGSFPFHKPGDQYEDVNYVGMRVFCAVLGALLVPLAYQCVWLLTHSIPASIFSAALILFDTGTLTLSRHILLDPILMFFIMTSTYSCLKFLTYSHKPFTLPWWIWLTNTGISLACALGVKFVGLFVILLVGYTTISDLWRLLGNHSISLVALSKHVAARVIGLILVPVLAYCVLFAVHLKVLDHSGNGDGFFSSAFQSQLIGNRLYNVSMPQYIAFGSEITLKQRRTGGAYLHSHFHLYPEEHPPKQQQVTTYSHKDDNNRWKIKPADREIGASDPLTYVQSGDLVRLEHVLTRRNLHSHKELAPLSKHHFQVSCYGQNGTGDANDIWIVDVEGASRGDKIQTVRSKIRFVHYHVRCLLHSHDKKLPKWGWEQLEVTCQPNLRDPTSMWSVEEVIDARLPNVSFEVYSPTFLEKLVESHAVMTQGNSGLKPKEGEVTSRPWQWPIDYRGQIFSGQDHRIYMLGNPIIFWSLLVIKVLFLGLWLAYSVGHKRKIPINKNLQIYCERSFRVCWWLLLAWFLHYAPFWSMSRVLYFHHYFPAFLYSAMFGGVMLDFLVTLTCVCVPGHLAVKVFHFCFLLIAAGILWSFYLFHPLAYGMSGSLAAVEGSMMHNVKWLDSWDI